MANLVGDPKHHRSARWILAAFYFLLVVGGLTMIYPFWMMLTRSISSELDYKDKALVPAYLYDRDELYLKFLTRRYPDFDLLRSVYGWEDIIRPIDFRGKIQAPEERPSAALIADWGVFLKQNAEAPYMILADPATTRLIYQGFLREKFVGSEGSPDELLPIERMNLAYDQMSTTFEFVNLPIRAFGHESGGDDEPQVFREFSEFVAGLDAGKLLPIDWDSQWQRWEARRGGGENSREQFLRESWPQSLQKGGDIISPQTDWRIFLQAKYGTDAALQAAREDPQASLTTAPLPYRQMDASLFVGHESELRWEMITENYITVMKFLLHRGRSIQNTVILVGLSVLIALTLNPLAAYGLSRFSGKHGRVPLLLMVMTIAFPAEVSMIPSFLLTRDLGLLNTYAALVLPGAVSGFSIFLLKGFFDALPEELFEAARIDGASELLMFRTLALPLSAPILAVTALGTFTAAYGGFMWALLVCQDPRMWTLMVWVFQFQMNNSTQPWLGMAAFAIASIPTLLVFIFCQRIILRGIIIPTEK